MENEINFECHEHEKHFVIGFYGNDVFYHENNKKRKAEGKRKPTIVVLSLSSQFAQSFV